jgi:hypothetical protein
VIKTLKVGGELYKITYDKTCIGEDGHNSRGQTHLSNHTIKVNTDGSKQDIADTLLHEALHCIWKHCNLVNEHEEQFVRSLTPAIIMVMKDNPGLVKFIMESSK